MILRKNIRRLYLESLKKKEFKKIFKYIRPNLLNNNFIESLKTRRGNTQKVERIYIKKIKDILDKKNIVYEEAGSQQPYDFRIKISPKIILKIDIKKTDNYTIICNDTPPKINCYYIVIFTGKDNIRTKINPKVIGINGKVILNLNENKWINEYQEMVNKCKEFAKRKRRENKDKNIPLLNAYTRPNYSFGIKYFINHKDNIFI